MKKHLCLFLAIFLFCSVAISAYALVPDRRREQFNTEQAWYFFPAPFSVPGIGEGVVFAGYYANIAESHVDVFGGTITGDFEAQSVGVLDWHLIDETLVFDFFKGQFQKASFIGYQGRGFDTDPEDYNVYEIGSGVGSGGQLSFMLFDRRFQISQRRFFQASKLNGVYDNEGNLLVDTSSSDPTSINTLSTGVVLDLTDDWYDARKGIRFSAFQSGLENENLDSSAAQQYVLDYNLLLYIPVGSLSTWVFNYYASEAVVTKEGESDRAVIEAELTGGVDCSSAADPTTCQETLDQIIDDTVTANTKGTASGLGGISRLRSYPQGRFSGAYTLFYGTEFRWNLNDEKKPFNWFFIKDIKTTTQLSFFYEQGSIADDRADLGKEWKRSVGAGFRLVTYSGAVMRLDVANGDEGTQPTLFFSYPWGDPVF